MQTRALGIEQGELQIARPLVHHERGEERPSKFGLATAGRAGDETMGDVWGGEAEEERHTFRV